MTSASPSAISFRLHDALLLLVASLVWGVAYVFIRQGIVLGAAPLAFAAARYALSAGGFAALAAARRERLPGRRDAAVSLGVGGVLVIGFYGGLLYWGEQFTTGGYASVLAASAPLMTALVGVALLASEPLGGRGAFGLAVGFAGIVVLVVPQLTGGSAGGWEGPVAILGAMASAAVGTVLLRRWSSRPQGLWQIGGQFAAAAALLAGLAAVLPSPETIPWTAGILGALVGLVLLSSMVGYFAYYSLHHRVGPVRANIVAYLVPIVGVGVGTGFFGEALSLWEVGGALIVIAGVSLVLLDRSSKR